MAVVTAKFKIKGLKAILINSFSIDALDPGKTKGGVSGKDENSWKIGALINGDRQLYIFSSYIRGCVIEGGKNIKVGRATLAKKVGSTLECSPDILVLEGSKVPPDNQITRNTMDDIYIDVRAVSNPMTKGKNIRFRIAHKPGWKIEGLLSWDDAQVSVEQMKQSFIYAGKCEGIGDGRKIGFGRFSLESFEIVD